jgi:hypothetical protein
MAKLEDMSPDQLIEEIRSLREENKSRREVSAKYEQSLLRFEEPQRAGLLHMISVLAENPGEGAILFRELADNIQGEVSTPPSVKPNLPTEEDEVEPDEMKKLVAETVMEALEAQREVERSLREKEEKEEFERTVAAWDAKAEALGYKPNSPEAADLFFMANKLNTSDLEEAHKELVKFNEFRDSGKEEEAEAEEEPEFPKTGGKGVGAPAQESEDMDFSDSKAVRAAVLDLVSNMDDDSVGV